MRTEFRNDLNRLHNELMKMGAAMEKTMDLLTEGIKNRDTRKLDEVIERDDIIDDYEASLEKKCLALILMQQPVAQDLRAVASSLKIITDMERIADHCADIAEYTKQIIAQSDKYGFDITSILEMLNLAKSMISQTISCYVNRDEKAAMEISMRDDAEDEYFKTVCKDIIKAMENDKSFIAQGAGFLYIIKYIERMADHATNICEWIAYRVTGERTQYN